MSDLIRSLIIDDDPFIRDLLRDKITQFTPEVRVVDTAGSGAEGLDKINKHHPDLVFLDVEMGDMTGFEMLTRIPEISFQTIFITSFNHYAIKAIRFNALDYLLKPIDLGELKQAIDRYRKNAGTGKPQQTLENALHNYKQEDVASQRLILQTQEGEMRYELRDIIRMEGERNYSYIILRNGKKKLTTKTLSDLEDMLSDKGFFRCHRSYIVNSSHIKGKPVGGTLILSDGAIVPISRRKNEAFLAWWGRGDSPTTM